MLNLQLCNPISVAWAIKPHASDHWQDISLEEKGSPCPRSFIVWHRAASITIPSIFSEPICYPLLSKAIDCMTQSKALGWHSSLWLSVVLSASVLSSTCFCRDHFAGFCFLDGGCQCFRGMKARFSGVWERGCAGSCIFQERGVQYSFSFTRLNNSKNVPLCGSYPLAL